MEKDVKIQMIEEAFQHSIAEGKVRTLSEFADLVGINRSGLSAARNGNEKYLTDSLVNKVRTAVYGPAEATQPAKEEGSVTIPSSVVQIYHDLSATVKTQQDTIKILVDMIRDEKGQKMNAG